MRGTIGVGRTLALLAVWVAGPGGAAAGQALPEWLRREMSELVADGGRWITDNRPYQSDDEPFDAYGLEWKWGVGQASITGRLYGLREGREVATFWEFRMDRHPGTGEVRLMQWGAGGALGVGPLRPTGNGVETEAVQVFFAPDGTSRRVRHLTITENGEHRTRSFDEVDGRWVPGRTYVWKRAAGPGRADPAGGAESNDRGGS